MSGRLEKFFFQKCNFATGDFLRMVEEIYAKGGKEMLTVFTRQAWMRRNGVIHGDLFIDPNELDWATTQVIDDYSLVQSLSKIVVGQEWVQNIAAWGKPNVGSFKVY